jgi:flagellar hook-associated protein 1 FlgK
MSSIGDLTLALRTASSGLLVNQAALNTIANNVANVNTEGYSRKIINLESRTVEGTGVGVQLADVTRAVDQGLIKSFRIESTTLGDFAVQEDFFERIQELFGEPADNTSISHLFNNFNVALESLSTQANGTIEQSELVRRSEDLVSKFQTMTDTLQELRQQADSQIGAAVEEINAISTNISEINDTLVRTQTVNNDPSALLDQRDLEINRLAQLVDIRTFTRSDGDVVVFTSGGRTLVDAIPAVLTHNVSSSVSSTLNEAAGTIDGIFVGTRIAGNNITDEVRGGELKGLIDIRDDVLVTLQSEIDELAGELRDVFNQIHNRGTAFPGAQTATGTRNFVEPSTQTITFNGTDDTTLTLFDSQGNQTDTTTIRTLLTTAGPHTIDAVATALQTYFQANGAANATAAVTNGKFEINLNNANLNFSFRDETATTVGSTAEDASIGYDAGGGLTKLTIGGTFALGDTVTTTINGTAIVSTATAPDATIADFRARIVSDINASAIGTGSTQVVTASAGSGIGEVILTLDKNGTNDTGFGFTAIASTTGTTTATVDGVDQTISGFSNFFGLNDFFVDGLPDNIHETNVLTGGFSVGAGTLRFSDDSGLLSGSPLTVVSGSSLTDLATQITNGITNVTAAVIPDGDGFRLRISHDQGKSLIITDNIANPDTILSDIGLHVADARVSSTIAVRADISQSPSKIATGAMQYNDDIGAAGEYFLGSGDDTTIVSLADQLAATNQFEQAGKLGALNSTFGEFANSILVGAANQAGTNLRNLEFQRSVTENLKLKADNISGVNLDEELAQLILFEQAFSAAARVIAVIQEMIDTLDRAVQ